MVTQELLTYIKTQQANHVSVEEIKRSLLEKKWPLQDIDLAISTTSQPQATRNDSDTPSSDKPGFFNKRIGRKRWAFTSIILNVLTPSLFKPEFGQLPMWIKIALIVLTVISYCFWFIHGIWRLNDIGRPKWYVLFIFIPIINIFIGLDLFFTKGKIHSLLTEKNVLGLPRCPSCGRNFSNNKTVCPYCKVALEH